MALPLPLRSMSSVPPRYANATELFAALSFDLDAAGPDPYFPMEHLASAPAPTDIVDDGEGPIPVLALSRPLEHERR